MSSASLGTLWGLGVALGGRVLVSLVHLGIQAWQVSLSSVTHAHHRWGRGAVTGTSDVTVGLGPQANIATTSVPHSLQRARER